MKTKKKGFSLVELVVVLTIMAIVAALCAPNVSAYLLQAKIQNYQTALHNLVDEVQTQLPQSRYWNWQEVQEKAETILESDSARTVEPVSGSENTYQIKNASSDANVVFQLQLTYDTATNTTQKVTIDGSCDGYSSVTVSEECNVQLKSSYVDPSSYPSITTTVETTDRSGWKKLLDDRVKTYKDWTDAFLTDEYKNNDFDKGSVPVQADDAVYFNTTDYPANSVSDIMFKMQRYVVTGPSGGNIGGTWYPDSVYVHDAVYPKVQVQDGRGTGGQYAACGVGADFVTQYQNVSILVGTDENDENNWVKYTDVFAENYYPKTEGQDDVTSAVARYIAFYGDTINSYKGSMVVNNPIVKYRIHLSDPTDATGRLNSRGWIYVVGMSQNVQPYKTTTTDDAGNTVESFDGISIKVNIPDYVEDLGALVTNHTSSDSSEQYFDTADLTQIDGETNAYRDTLGNKVIFNGAFAWPQISVYYKDGDYEIKSDGGGYYYEYDEKKYFGETVTSGWHTIYQWAGNYWITDWRNGGNWVIYLESDKIPSGSGLNVQSDSGGSYYEYHNKIYLTTEETAVVSADYARMKKYQNGKFFINLENSGYSVGDIIKLTFNNVDVDKFADYAELNGGNSFVQMYTKETYEAGLGYLANGIFYDSSDIAAANQGKVIRDYTNGSVTLYLYLKWSDYPYLSFQYQGAYQNFTPDLHLDASWEKKTTQISETTDSVYTPMVTINGNDNYAIVTLDWSKCDYIDTDAEAEQIGLRFTTSSSFTYELYDAEYARLSFTPILPTVRLLNMPSATRQKIIADKVVHFYCKGIGVDEIKCEILAPNPPAVTTTTPAVTTTTEATTTTTTTTTKATTTSTTTTTTKPTTTSTTTTTTNPTTTSTTTTTTKPTTTSTTTTTTKPTTTSTTTTTTNPTTTSTTTTTTNPTTTSTTTTTTKATATSTTTTTTKATTTSTTTVTTTTVATTTTLANGNVALNVHYIYDRPTYNMVNIWNERWPSDVVLPNISYQTLSESADYALLFDEETDAVCIVPMLNGSQVTPNYSIANVLDTRAINSSYNYYISYNQVAAGLTEIWIYNGQIYTVKPAITDTAKRLTIHYLQDDTNYNVIEFAKNDDVKMQYSSWTTFTSSEDITATFYQDGVLRIAPKYGGGSVTPNYDDTDVLDTRKESSDTGYPYYITYDRVAAGTNELWIYNGQIYTANPTQSLTVHFVNGDSAYGTISYAGSGLVSGVMVGDVSYSSSESIVVQVGKNGYLQIIPKQDGAAVLPDTSISGVLDTSTSGDYWYITQDDIAGGLTDVWIYRGQVYQQDVCNFTNIQNIWETFLANYGDDWKNDGSKRELHTEFEKIYGNLSQAQIPTDYLKKIFADYPTKDWATKPLYWVPYPFNFGDGKVVTIYMGSRAPTWTDFINAKIDSDYRKGYVVVVDGTTYVRGNTQTSIAWPTLPKQDSLASSDPSSVTYSKGNYINYLFANGFTVAN